MKASWIKEKAYCAKRAEKLRCELDDAIKTGNREAFLEAYSKAMRYLKTKELREYYLDFIRAELKRRHQNNG